MNKIIKCLVFSVTLGLFAMQAKAVPALGEVWGSGGPSGLLTWHTADLIGSFPASTGGVITPAQPGGTSVTLTFPNGGPSPYASLNTVDPNYVGNYALLGSGLFVKFTFDPKDFAPNPAQGLALYFQSGTDIWYLDGITTPMSTGAQTYILNIGSAGNWMPEIGNIASWATAFTSINEIGFTINGVNWNLEQRYQFSDISLLTSQYLASVPEPETVWMILMVLASLGLTFRGRLAEFAGQIKARVKA